MIGTSKSLRSDMKALIQYAYTSKAEAHEKIMSAVSKTVVGTQAHQVRGRGGREGGEGRGGRGGEGRGGEGRGGEGRGEGREGGGNGGDGERGGWGGRGWDRGRERGRAKEYSGILLIFSQEEEGQGRSEVVDRVPF